MANAGGDLDVTLPVSVIQINGSKSSDDLRIARWKWTRDPKSLAAGTMVGTSDQASVLELIGAVPGQYNFQLQVPKWKKTSKAKKNFRYIAITQ